MGKLISIVIPTFNEQKTIGECLKSLKNQTYKPIEITVVDDGSSDSTRNIVEDSQNIKLLTQGHKGPGQARNLGAANAKGEILVFVDADMTLDKNFIRFLLMFQQFDQILSLFLTISFLENVPIVLPSTIGFTKSLIKFLSRVISASTKTRISPLAFAAPRFLACPGPLWLWVNNFISEKPLTILRVESEEPSSTTVISSGLSLIF